MEAKYVNECNEKIPVYIFSKAKELGCIVYVEEANPLKQGLKLLSLERNAKAENPQRLYVCLTA